MIRADRTALPRPGPNPPYRFPAIHRENLPNGLHLWTLPDARLPIVSVLLLIEVGSAADPADAYGLASLTGDLVDEGSGSRSAIEIHDALARIGARFETEVGSDATVFGLSMLSRHVDAGLALLGDIVVRPRLAVEDFDRVRQLRVHRLRQLRDQPSASADRAFLRRVYGDHPYGHLAVGNEESLERLHVERVTAFHREAYDPRHATLIVAGDMTPATLAAAAARAFGEWEVDKGSAFRPVDAGELSTNGSRGLAVVPRAGAAQSELRIGHVGVSRATPDFHALLVLNMVLGGQFISRVNLNLRERKGYTYGARTTFEFRRGRGPFLLQTAVQTDVTADAAREAVREIEDIRGSRPITLEELEVAQAALTRGYARNFETGEQISRAALQLALHDLSEEYFDTFVNRINAITIDDVVAAAERHLDPRSLATVIVGDRDAIAEPLRDAGFGDAVIVE